MAGDEVAQGVRDAEQRLKKLLHELEDAIEAVRSWDLELTRLVKEESSADSDEARYWAGRGIWANYTGRQGAEWGLDVARERVEQQERRVRALHAGTEDPDKLDRIVVTLIEGAILGIIGNAAYAALLRVLQIRRRTGEASSLEPLSYQDGLLVAKCAACVRLRQASLPVPHDIDDLQLRSSHLLVTGTWDFEFRFELNRIIVSVPSDYPERKGIAVHINRTLSA